MSSPITIDHDDVIKWKHFPRNWPFVRGIHRSRWIPRTKGQWRGALMFSLIWAWINGWVNNREAGDSRRHRGHYDVNVMWFHGAVRDVLVFYGCRDWLVYPCNHYYRPCNPCLRLTLRGTRFSKMDYDTVLRYQRAHQDRFWEACEITT